MSGVRVAELYASLGLKPITNEWAKADKMLQGLGNKLQRFSKATQSKLGGALGVAGVGLAFVGAAKDALAFNSTLTRMAIDGQHALGTVDQMRTKFLDLSKATGASKEDLTDAVGRFVELTGDGKAATAAMETFAKVMRATGSSAEDVGSISAAMIQNMGIATEDLNKSFSVLISGGKLGAVSFKNLAALMAPLSASAQRFAGSKGLGGLAELSAGLQVARQGFGSAEEAATGLESLMGNVILRQKELQANGIHVFGKDGKLNDFKSIVEQLKNSKLAKTPGGIEGALGRKEAIAAYYALTKVNGAWDDMMTKIRGAEDLNQDFDEYQQSAAGRASTAWNKLKIAIAEAFTPERIERLTHAIEAIVQWVLNFVDKIGGAGRALEIFVGIWATLKFAEIAGGFAQVVGAVLKFTGAMKAAAEANAALDLAGKGGGIGILGRLSGALGGAATLSLGTVAAAGAAAAGGLYVGNKISHGLDLHEGDAGYNDDYMDPAYAAAVKRGKLARTAKMFPSWMQTSGMGVASIGKPAGPITLTQTITVVSSDPRKAADSMNSAAGKKGAEGAARRVQAATGR